MLVRETDERNDSVTTYLRKCESRKAPDVMVGVTRAANSPLQCLSPAAQLSTTTMACFRSGRRARWTSNQELLPVLRDGEREIRRQMRDVPNGRREQPTGTAGLERRSGGFDLDSHHIATVHEEQLATVPAPPRRDLSLFAQDQWQVRPNVTINYGLRWDAQLMADTVDPATTAYASFVKNPSFLSDGTIPNQLAEFQPRFGIAWDVKSNSRTVVRANAGLYYARNNMLSQAGSVTANGLQNQGAVRGLTTGLVRGGVPMPTWPGLVEIPPLPPGQFPLFTAVRVTASDYHNPKIGTVNAALEQALAPDWSLYLDFTWSKGVDLSQFLNINTAGRGAPFSPQLSDVFVHTSLAHSLYRGATVGVRKRFSRGYQLDANHVLSKDMDTDSSERDPFLDRSFDLPLSELDRLYAPSDRDIRHKFNLFAYGNLPAGIIGNSRIQARSAQPITPTGGGPDQRNSIRKDNEFFTFDWRIMRPFRFGNRYELTPTFEMFNTFNNKNNINPLVVPALFNFDGFLRLGVGDPRQVQLSVKFVF